MNGSLSSNIVLLKGLLECSGELACETLVCPPFPYLAQASDILSGSVIRIGAQNLNHCDAGAYTGEVSAGMLKDFSCSHVIVGHSERRVLFGESDDLIVKKFAAATRADLVPILCVGETLAQRESGETSAVVRKQLLAVLDVLGVEVLRRSVVAYEPVWAIGTGLSATPDQAQAVHRQIRSVIAERDAGVAESVSILYGGSVKPGNAAELFAQPDIDGGLIGGAAMVAEDFLAICRAAY